MLSTINSIGGLGDMWYLFPAHDTFMVIFGSITLLKIEIGFVFGIIFLENSHRKKHKKMQIDKRS